MKGKTIKIIYLVLISLCALCFLFSATVTVLALIAMSNGRLDGGAIWLSLISAILMLALMTYMIFDFVKISKRKEEGLENQDKEELDDKLDENDASSEDQSNSEE